MTLNVLYLMYVLLTPAKLDINYLFAFAIVDLIIFGVVPYLEHKSVEK